MTRWMSGLVLAVAAACSSSAEPEPKQLTFDDVAPIFARSCTHCHKPGGVAPFPLEAAEESRRQASRIATAVEDRIMPPWDAQVDDDCQPPLPFLHDESLSDTDRQLILDWVADGALPGAESTRAISAMPSALEPPYLTVEMSEAYKPPSKDDFHCFVIDPHLTQDAYAVGVDFTPGNRDIVHHSSLLIDATRSAETPDKLGPQGYDCSTDIAPAGVQELHPWTPGMGPAPFPPDASVRIPAGSLFIILIHYASHSSGPPELVMPDRSAFQVRLVDQPTKYVVVEGLFGANTLPAAEHQGNGLLPGPADRGKTEFFIPVNTSGHTETMVTPITATVPRLFAVQAHAHFAAKQVRADVIKPDGRRVCLLKDRWNFFWQRRYFYDTDQLDALPSIEPGDTVQVQCTYDNSTANSALVTYRAGLGRTLEDLAYGGNSTDEMCHVLVHTVTTAQ